MAAETAPPKPDAAPKPGLTAAQILQKKAPPAGLPPEPLDVPELGGRVYVRRITAAGLDEYQSAVDDAGGDAVRGVILSFALGDDAGRRLFTDSPDTTRELSQLESAAAARVIRAFNRLNGLVESDVAKK